MASESALQVTALASCDTPPVSTFQQSQRLNQSRRAYFARPSGAGSCTCANALHSAFPSQRYAATLAAGRAAFARGTTASASASTKPHRRAPSVRLRARKAEAVAGGPHHQGRGEF